MALQNNQRPGMFWDGFEDDNLDDDDEDSQFIISLEDNGDEDELLYGPVGQSRAPTEAQSRVHGIPAPSLKTASTHGPYPQVPAALPSAFASSTSQPAMPPLPTLHPAFPAASLYQNPARMHQKRSLAPPMLHPAPGTDVWKQQAVSGPSGVSDLPSAHRQVTYSSLPITSSAITAQEFRQLQAEWMGNRDRTGKPADRNESASSFVQSNISNASVSHSIPHNNLSHNITQRRISSLSSDSVHSDFPAPEPMNMHACTKTSSLGDPDIVLAVNESNMGLETIHLDKESSGMWDEAIFLSTNQGISDSFRDQSDVASNENRGLSQSLSQKVSPCKSSSADFTNEFMQFLSNNTSSTVAVAASNVSVSKYPKPPPYDSVHMTVAPYSVPKLSGPFPKDFSTEKQTDKTLDASCTGFKDHSSDPAVKLLLAQAVKERNAVESARQRNSDQISILDMSTHSPKKNGQCSCIMCYKSRGCGSSQENPVLTPDEILIINKDPPKRKNSGPGNSGAKKRKVSSEEVLTVITSPPLSDGSIPIVVTSPSSLKFCSSAQQATAQSSETINIDNTSLQSQETIKNIIQQKQQSSESTAVTYQPFSFSNVSISYGKDLSSTCTINLDLPTCIPATSHSTSHVTTYTTASHLTTRPDLLIQLLKNSKPLPVTGDAPIPVISQPFHFTPLVVPQPSQSHTFVIPKSAPQKVFLKPTEVQSQRGNLNLSTSVSPSIVSTPSSTIAVTSSVPSSPVFTVTSPSPLRINKSTPSPQATSVPSIFANQGNFKIIYVGKDQVLLCPEQTPTTSAVKVTETPKKITVIPQSKQGSSLPSSLAASSNASNSNPVSKQGVISTVDVRESRQHLKHVLQNAEKIDLSNPGKVLIKLKPQLPSSAQKEVITQSYSTTSRAQKTPATQSLVLNMASSSQNTKDTVRTATVLSAPPQNSLYTKSLIHKVKSPVKTSSNLTNVVPTSPSSVGNKNPSPPSQPGKLEVTNTLLRLINSHFQDQTLTANESKLLNLIRGACKNPEALKTLGSAMPQEQQIVQSPGVNSTTQSRPIQRVHASSSAVSAGSQRTNQPLGWVSTDHKPHPPQEKLPSSYIEDWVNEAKIYTSENLQEENVIEEIRQMDRSISSGFSNGHSQYRINSGSFSKVPPSSASLVSKLSANLDKKSPNVLRKDVVQKSRNVYPFGDADGTHQTHLSQSKESHNVHITSGTPSSKAKLHSSKKEDKGGKFSVLTSKHSKKVSHVSQESSISESKLHKSKKQITGQNNVFMPIPENEGNVCKEKNTNQKQHMPSKSNDHSGKKSRKTPTSSVVSSSKGIKLKIKLNKLKKTNSKEKLDLSRPRVDQEPPKIDHPSLQSLQNKPANEPETEVEDMSDGENEEPKEKEKSETAEEMFQRFQEEAMKEVFNAQLGVGYLSRSLRPSRSTMAFLDRINPYQITGAPPRKKKLEYEEKSSAPIPAVETSSTNVQSNAQISKESESKQKTPEVANKRIAEKSLTGEEVEPPKAKHVKLSRKDSPRLKLDNSIMNRKKLFCNNILAGHKVYVKFNVFENIHSGRAFLVPFFNIGGSRTQFDVEDMEYINKSVLEFEKEDRSCARHLLFYVREGNKASFLRKETGVQIRPLSDKSYKRSSFILEGFKRGVSKPVDPAPDQWTVDNKVDIEIDRAELENDVEVEFDEPNAAEVKFDEPVVGCAQVEVDVAEDECNELLTDFDATCKNDDLQPGALCAHCGRIHSSDAEGKMIVRERASLTELEGQRTVVEEASPSKAEGNRICGQISSPAKSERKVASPSYQPNILKGPLVQRGQSEVARNLCVSHLPNCVSSDLSSLPPESKSLLEESESSLKIVAACSLQGVEDDVEFTEKLQELVGSGSLQGEELHQTSETAVAAILPPLSSKLSNGKDLQTSTAPDNSSLFIKQENLNDGYEEATGFDISKGNTYSESDHILTYTPLDALASKIVVKEEPIDDYFDSLHSWKLPETTGTCASVMNSTAIESTDKSLTNQLKFPPIVDNVDSGSAEVNSTDINIQQQQQGMEKEILSGGLSQIESKDTVHSETLESVVHESTLSTIPPSTETPTTKATSETGPSLPESPTSSSPIEESSDISSSSEINNSEEDEEENELVGENVISHTGSPSPDLMDGDKQKPPQTKITSLVESLRQRLNQHTPQVPSWFTTPVPVIQGKIKKKKKKASQAKDLLADETKPVKDSIPSSESVSMPTPSVSKALTPDTKFMSHACEEVQSSIQPFSKDISASVESDMVTVNNATSVVVVSEPATSKAAGPEKPVMGLPSTDLLKNTFEFDQSLATSKNVSIGDSVPESIIESTKSPLCTSTVDETVRPDFIKNSTTSLLSSTHNTISLPGLSMSESQITPPVISPALSQPSISISSLYESSNQTQPGTGNKKEASTNKKILILPVPKPIKTEPKDTAEDHTPSISFNSSNSMDLPAAAAAKKTDKSLTFGKETSKSVPEVKQEVHIVNNEEPEIIDEEVSFFSKADTKDTIVTTNPQTNARITPASIRSTPSDIEIDIGEENLPEDALSFQPIIPEYDLETEPVKVGSNANKIFDVRLPKDLGFSPASSPGLPLEEDVQTTRQLIDSCVDKIWHETRVKANKQKQRSRKKKVTETPSKLALPSDPAEVKTEGSVADYLSKKFSSDSKIKGPRLVGRSRPANKVDQKPTTIAQDLITDSEMSKTPLITDSEMSKTPDLSEIFGVDLKKEVSPTQLKSEGKVAMKKESAIGQFSKVQTRRHSQVAKKGTSHHRRMSAAVTKEVNKSGQSEKPKTIASSEIQNVEPKTSASSEIQNVKPKTSASSEIQNVKPKTSASSEIQNVKPKSSASSEIQNMKPKASASSENVRSPFLTWRQLTREAMKTKDSEKDADKSASSSTCESLGDKEPTTPTIPCKILVTRLEDTKLGSYNNYGSRALTVKLEPADLVGFQIIKQEPKEPEEIIMEQKEYTDQAASSKTKIELQEHIESDATSSKGRSCLRKIVKKKKKMTKSKAGRKKPQKDIVDYYAPILESLHKKAQQLEEESKQSENGKHDNEETDDNAPLLENGSAIAVERSTSNEEGHERKTEILRSIAEYFAVESMKTEEKNEDAKSIFDIDKEGNPEIIKATGNELEMDKAPPEEIALQNREKALREREKALEEREKALREKALREREKALEAKEKEIMQPEKHPETEKKSSTHSEKEAEEKHVAIEEVPSLDQTSDDHNQQNFEKQHADDTNMENVYAEDKSDVVKGSDASGVGGIEHLVPVKRRTRCLRSNSQSMVEEDLELQQPQEKLEQKKHTSIKSKELCISNTESESTRLENSEVSLEQTPEKTALPQGDMKNETPVSDKEETSVFEIAAADECHGGTIPKVISADTAPTQFEKKDILLCSSVTEVEDTENKTEHMSDTSDPVPPSSGNPGIGFEDDPETALQEELEKGMELDIHEALSFIHSEPVVEQIIHQGSAKHSANVADLEVVNKGMSLTQNPVKPDLKAASDIQSKIPSATTLLVPPHNPSRTTLLAPSQNPTRTSANLQVSPSWRRILGQQSLDDLDEVTTSLRECTDSLSVEEQQLANDGQSKNIRFKLKLPVGTVSKAIKMSKEMKNVFGEAASEDPLPAKEEMHEQSQVEDKSLEKSHDESQSLNMENNFNKSEENQAELSSAVKSATYPSQPPIPKLKVKLDSAALTAIQKVKSQFLKRKSKKRKLRKESKRRLEARSKSLELDPQFQLDLQFYLTPHERRASSGTQSKENSNIASQSDAVQVKSNVAIKTEPVFIENMEQAKQFKPVKRRTRHTRSSSHAKDYNPEIKQQELLEPKKEVIDQTTGLYASSSNALNPGTNKSTVFTSPKADGGIFSNAGLFNNASTESQSETINKTQVDLTVSKKKADQLLKKKAIDISKLKLKLNPFLSGQLTTKKPKENPAQEIVSSIFKDGSGLLENQNILLHSKNLEHESITLPIKQVSNSSEHTILKSHTTSSNSSIQSVPEKPNLAEAKQLLDSEITSNIECNTQNERAKLLPSLNTAKLCNILKSFHKNVSGSTSQKPGKELSNHESLPVTRSNFRGEAKTSADCRGRNNPHVLYDKSGPPESSSVVLQGRTGGARGKTKSTRGATSQRKMLAVTIKKEPIDTDYYSQSSINPVVSLSRLKDQSSGSGEGKDERPDIKVEPEEKGERSFFDCLTSVNPDVWEVGHEDGDK